MPVVDFYMKGVTNEELSRVSFVRTCTLKEDMDRVSNELNLNLDTDTWIILGGISRTSTPFVWRRSLQFKPRRNLWWHRKCRVQCVKLHLSSTVKRVKSQSRGDFNWSYESYV